jgi:D-galacturonate reductase
MTVRRKIMPHSATAVTRAQYTPDDAGYFAGQQGYGYRSIECFIECCTELNEGRVRLEDLEQRGLPTIACARSPTTVALSQSTCSDTLITTAILEAGRRSLDEKRSIALSPTSTGSWQFE